MGGGASLNRAALMAFCGLLAAIPVYADSEHNAKPAASRNDPDAMLRHKMRDAINAGLVGIVAEGTDYTADVALTLAGEQTGVRLLPIAGAGALQNAEDVVFARGVDCGVVQADVLDEIKRHPPFPGIEKYVQYVTKLYDQDLHVLAGPDIQSIDGLRGKKVNFGLRDSGTYITATKIFNTLGVQTDVTILPQPLALDKLRRGEISALVYLATKPSRLFQDVRPDEHLHFVPITGDLSPTYTAISITSDDYPELVSKDAPVDSVAVGTVLVSYNWPTNSERYHRLNRFVQAFFAHLKDIKARRPKWRDFDVSAPVAGWTRFPAAQQWVKKAELSPAPDKATMKERVRLDPQEREALFRGFADFQRTREPQKAAVDLKPEQREALFRDFSEYQRTRGSQKAAADLKPEQREALFRDFAMYQKQQQVILAYHDAGANQ
jgi:TRAP-type uncharacterized transport system substrate-binding protein